MQNTGRPHVLIVGAGFAGLNVARRLKRADVEVTIVDRYNYHTFIPLLYQVATAGLEPEEIAQPVRRVFHGARNISFRLANVVDFDLDRRVVITNIGELTYDYLVVAAGSVTNYFGLESLAPAVQNLRELNDAEDLRNHLLGAFERATYEPDPKLRQHLMTVVIVGGGPTGVELAGAMAELRKHVLPRDYPELDISSARLVLVEASGRLLAGMPEKLAAVAHKTLESMGVEVFLNSPVTAVNSGVILEKGQELKAGTVIWVAGVRAPPLAEKLRAPSGPGGRVIVKETLQLMDRPEVYVIGDMAYLPDASGQPYPMVAPVAIQQGELVAANILSQIRNREPKPFTYRDKGDDGHYR